MHWTDGTLFDLERIAERCRDVGAALVVDATQSVGALPFDVQRIRPDALVVATYKWLLGPYSLAFAYFSERFAAGRPLEEGWIARAGSEDFAGLVRYRDDYQPGAIRHDMGERANLLLMPIALAALRQTLEWGVDRIQAYCGSLSEPVAAALEARGYSVAPAEERCGHLVGIRLPAGVDGGRLQKTLSERKVYVSRRGDALRLAPHVYNDAADLRALEEALAQV